MSNHWNESRSCLQKRVFYDSLIATQACLSLNRKDPQAYLRIYACTFCYGLHITSGGVVGYIKGLRRILKTTIKLMSCPDWWIKCPEELRELVIEREIYAIREILSYK